MATVSQALKINPDNIELAILDIEVVNGKSHPAARRPMIFLSANARASLPEDLKEIPYISKPFVPGNLVRLSKSLNPALAESHA